MICPNCGFDNVPGTDECKQCKQDLTHIDIAPAAMDAFEKRLLADTIRVLKPTKPIPVKPSDTLRHALGLLVEHKVGAVVVLDEAGKLVGILSERDLTLKVVGKGLALDACKVAGYMTARPTTIKMDDPLVYAFHKMDVGEYRHLPVVEDGEVPVGMISVKGLLTYVARHLGER